MGACCVQISGCAAGHGSGGQQAAGGGHDSDGEDGHQEMTSALSQHMGSQEEAAGQLGGEAVAAVSAGAGGAVGAAGGLQWWSGALLFDRAGMLCAAQ